jgi:hypothetical protein
MGSRARNTRRQVPAKKANTGLTLHPHPLLIGLNGPARTRPSQDRCFSSKAATRECSSQQPRLPLSPDSDSASASSSQRCPASISAKTCRNRVRPSAMQRLIFTWATCARSSEADRSRPFEERATDCSASNCRPRRGSRDEAPGPEGRALRPSAPGSSVAQGLGRCCTGPRDPRTGPPCCHRRRCRRPWAGASSPCTGGSRSRCCARSRRRLCSEPPGCCRPPGWSWRPSRRR